MIDVYAIDYDGTYSDNPAMWRAALATIRCHVPVICATWRRDTPANRAELFQALEGVVNDIVFCGHGHKRAHCEARGYRVKVWIDNDPRTDEPWAPCWWCRLAGGLQWLLGRKEKTSPAAGLGGKLL